MFNNPVIIALTIGFALHQPKIIRISKVLERQQNWLTRSQCPPTDACSRWRRGGRRNSDFQLGHADSGCSPVVFRSLLRHMDSMDTPAAFGLSICATGAGAA